MIVHKKWEFKSSDNSTCLDSRKRHARLIGKI